MKLRGMDSTLPHLADSKERLLDVLIGRAFGCRHRAEELFIREITVKLKVDDSL